VCLVAPQSADALRALFGLPADWPITPAVLNQDIVLQRQQQITVEGTIVGAAVGERYVLADAVLTGAEGKRETSPEVHLFWGPRGQAEAITEPGVHTAVFPCSYVAEKTESVRVTVRELSPDDVRTQLARAMGTLEGSPTGLKAYGQYTPIDVYRRAAGRDRVDVDFTDVIAEVRLGSPPQRFRTVRVQRAGQLFEVPVSHVFDTVAGVTCLVPATSLTPSSQAARLLSGEKVRIRGTTVGPRGASNCVVVDYIGFPDMEQEAVGRPNWLVTIEYPGLGQAMIWDYGRYALSNLPCQHAPGRMEVLQVLYSEFRAVRVRGAAAPPAAE